jgi:lipoprotein NlpI
MNLIDSVLLIVSLAVSGESPQTAQDYVSRGMQQFRENNITDSLHDFDRAAKITPEAAPHLWQRGICHYYAKKFQQGREQFESHQQVNPHDVENATWHFLCVAKLDGLEAARKALIPINTARDLRIPMAQIYELYAGHGSEKSVLAAAKIADSEIADSEIADSEIADSERAQMYAHLYLGLYYEVAGNTKQAQLHMKLAAAAKLHNNYMHEVAKIHLLQRDW